MTASKKHSGSKPRTPKRTKPTKPRQPPWAETEGTCIRARSLIDEVDALEVEATKRWGAGRLRLIVPPEARERFDTRRREFERAIASGTLEEVEEACGWMAKAWRRLDEIAVRQGHEKFDPVVWEIAHPDGSVSAIVRTWAEAVHVVASGRRVRVYTLAQIGELLETARGDKPVIGEPVEEYEGEEVLRPVAERIWTPDVWDLEDRVETDHASQA